MSSKNNRKTSSTNNSKQNLINFKFKSHLLLKHKIDFKEDEDAKKINSPLDAALLIYDDIHEVLKLDQYKDIPELKNNMKGASKEFYRIKTHVDKMLRTYDANKLEFSLIYAYYMQLVITVNMFRFAFKFLEKIIMTYFQIKCAYHCDYPGSKYDPYNDNSYDKCVQDHDVCQKHYNLVTYLKKALVELV